MRADDGLVELLGHTGNELSYLRHVLYRIGEKWKDGEYETACYMMEKFQDEQCQLCLDLMHEVVEEMEDMENADEDPEERGEDD